ncbi:MAG: N-acetylmuramoyl-L-alanine amidase, partial [Albidovulum sp.]
MRAFALLILLICGTVFVPAPLPAFGAEGGATIDVARSGLADDEGGSTLNLTLSRTVPYRTFLLAGPPRLVLDLAEVD